MKCPNHLLTEVAGYCAVCGMFACEACLTVHEGHKYCSRHYKPIGDKIKAESNSAEIRKKHGRHQLIVHFLDGKKAMGFSRSMNAREAGFFLECEDKKGVATGESLRVQFSQVKYIANVKSYTGRFDTNEQHPEYRPSGNHIVIRFQDGEILEGTTMQIQVPNDPRFYLIPNDPTSNNINMLVEQNSIERILSPEEFLSEKKEKKSKRKRADKGDKPDRKQRRSDDADAAGFEGAGEGEEEHKEPPLSQDESMGDFYFETRNYPGALEQYAAARQKAPHSVRLRKKVIVTLINIGIQFMKTREFPSALEYMEKALELEPKNPQAYKRAKQLRKVIDKTEKRMREYYEEQEQKKQP